KALPDEVSKYASSLLDAGRLWSPSTTIDTQNFIGFVAAEADRLSSKRKRDNASKGKGKNTGAQDEALAATASQEKKSRPPRRKGKCNYCGKEGHWERECRTKQREEAAGGQATSQTPKQQQKSTQSQSRTSQSN